MVGHSAALVAMTGEEDFLEAAVQRFCGLRPRQRAELGQVLVYLMLDGHASPTRQEVFRPGRIPGLHEFQPRPTEPNALLHAKLALLGFSTNRTAPPIHLRLAVLTANFTYESARRQLELVWTVDLPLDVRLEGTARTAERADIAAAAHFVSELLGKRFYRDEEGLRAGQQKLTARLDLLLGRAENLAPARRRSRFVHSLRESLYDQIRQRFRNAINKRNLLLCGSGFYEEPTGKAKKPDVFEKLEELGVFTANVRRVALVEPREAGAIADWARKGATDGWEVLRPSDALSLGRELHATSSTPATSGKGTSATAGSILGRGTSPGAGCSRTARCPRAISSAA